MESFKQTDTTANRIRIAMEKAGKKQADIVRETGIDKSAMSNYLKGRYEPKQDAVYRIAKSLNVSEMWLWGYDCPMERSAEQKNNDTIADIVVRMRMDSDFMSVVEDLHSLDETKFAAVRQMLSAFLK